MSLSRKNKVRFELDGIVGVWQTTSDIGTTVTAGESGINPKDGKTVKTPGTRENRPLTLTKIYDPIDDKLFVDLLLDESSNAALRSGNTKATIIFEGETGNTESKFILSGLQLSNFAIPGRDGLSPSWGMLSVEFELGSIRQA